MAGTEEYLRHVELLRPEFCNLDCERMNFAEGDYIMANNTLMLRKMAGMIRDMKVSPELEVFDTGHLAFANNLSERAVFSAFSIGRMQLPYIAMSAFAGGNVRVGFEDNLYLSRGVLVTKAQMVERAVTILEAKNSKLLGPEDVCEKLLRHKNL